jgi:hypothetical protein
MLVEDENISRKVPSGTTQKQFKLYIILPKLIGKQLDPSHAKRMSATSS